MTIPQKRLYFLPVGHVAQLVRARRSHRRGQRFKSSHAHNWKTQHHSHNKHKKIGFIINFITNYQTLTKKAILDKVSSEESPKSLIKDIKRN